MKTFKSWDEVAAYLSDPDEYNTVTYGAWCFSEHYMSCGEPHCCEDSYDSVEETVESIKDYSNGRLDLVTAND